MGVGVERRIFGGRLFYGLYGTALPDSTSQAISEWGTDVMDTLKSLIMDKEIGFSISFRANASTQEEPEQFTLSFSFRDMVDKADNVMVFGHPKNSLHRIRDCSDGSQNSLLFIRYSDRWQVKHGVTHLPQMLSSWLISNIGWPFLTTSVVTSSRTNSM